MSLIPGRSIKWEGKKFQAEPFVGQKPTDKRFFVGSILRQIPFIESFLLRTKVGWRSDFT